MTALFSTLRYLCGNCETDLKDVVAELSRANAHTRRNAPPECPACGVVPKFSLAERSMRAPGARNPIKVARTRLPSVMRTQ